ncbi:MAG TPA: glycoside hydrolase family 16 protein [Gemmatimonadales bacterium]
MALSRRLGRRVSAAALLLFLAACTTDPTGPGAPERAPGAGPAFAETFGGCPADPGDYAPSGWTPHWVEDFSTNLSKWNIWTGGAWNDELQYYQNDVDNLSLSEGILTIAAVKETVTGVTNPYDATPKTFGFTSGRIESKTLFGAGSTANKVRFAARIRIASGYGMWPAFWSYGDPWPTQGEIDILEARGNMPFQYQTAYYFGRRSGVNLVQNSAIVIQSQSSLTDCWHVYEVAWTKDALTFYLDGQVVDVKTGGYVPSLYRKREKLTLNLAVGGVFFWGLDPEHVTIGSPMQVDWVKVFTAK